VQRGQRREHKGGEDGEFHVVDDDWNQVTVAPGPSSKAICPQGAGRGQWDFTGSSRVPRSPAWRTGAL
jgi:hypothetical protein